MPQPKTQGGAGSADDKDLAARLEQAEKDLADRDEQIKTLDERAAKLEQAEKDLADRDKPPEPGPVGDYVVTGAGVSYALPDDEMPIRLALRGRVISVTETEARRLLALGVIAAATDADVAREQIARERELLELQVPTLNGPASNPFGGSIRGSQSLEEHAADEIAKAARERKG